MAKRQITINDGSKERKQVDLNLNPVSIQPTIRNGGNYRIAVQQTPKTNSLLQLSAALKGGVELYGKAVKVAQEKAAYDVETMSEEDFDTFVNEGLDEESRNIFGYTKAYNQALAKKYYAEEMPTKLQSIASELHKDPYQYKTPEEFEAAANAAVSGAYEEADALLGGNVFGDQANNALKSVTKADFVKKQQASYLQKLPEITRNIQSDVAFKAFSELEDLGNVKITIDQQLGAVFSAVGNNTDSNAIVSKSYLDVAELKAQQGDYDVSQAMLDELDSTDMANFGMQGRRQFGDGKIELFNTSENRSRIEKIQDAIENDSARSMALKKNRAEIATAEIGNELFSIITGEGGSEELGFQFTEKLLKELGTDKSLKRGEAVYDDPIEVKELREYLLGVQSNPQLFKLTAMSNFIATNGQAEASTIGQLRSPDTLILVNKAATDRLYDQKLWKAGKASLTPEGVTFNSDFTKKQEALEQDLFKSIAHLQDGEKQAQFSALYPEKVTAPMQAWVTQTLESLEPTEVEQKERAIVSSDELEKLNSIYSPEEVKGIVAERIALANQEEVVASDIFAATSGGERRLKGSDMYDSYPSSKGELGQIISVQKSYRVAMQKGFFKDTQEQIKGFDAVYAETLERDEYVAGVRERIGDEYKRNPVAEFFRELSFEERAQRKQKLRSKLSYYGISAKELVEDQFYKQKFTVSELYGSGGVDFAAFPLFIDGSIQGIINEIDTFDKDPKNYQSKLIVQIANKHNITVPRLLEAQRRFLTKNNFIR